VALLSSACADDPSEPTFALDLAEAQVAAGDETRVLATLTQALASGTLTRPLRGCAASLEAGVNFRACRLDRNARHEADRLRAQDFLQRIAWQASHGWCANFARGMVQTPRMFGPKFLRGEAATPAPSGNRPRVAAYDLGSNSFHLLVAEADGAGGLVELARGQEMVRLGEESLRDGIIPFSTFQRGLDGLLKLRKIADGFMPESTIAVATSAIREARNGADFVSTVAREVGLQVEVLDPVRETTLIYWGARQALDLGANKFALVDVGGGSIKALVGNAKECLFATSLRMGVLRLRDEYNCNDIRNRADLLTAETRVRAVVQPAVMQMLKVGFDFVTFTSGTALALARMAEGSTEKVADARGRSGEGMGRNLVLSLDKLCALEERLVAASAVERAAMPGVGSMRADTVLPGTIMLRTLLELTNSANALVCESALKEGLVVDYFARRQTGLAEELPEAD
jgi:exopolyphosphatase/guanosine-5'-triphosphate,3'-diphosphate pyrophosphatase